MNKAGIRNSAIVAMVFSAAIAGAQGIGVQVNNEAVTFRNQEPVYISGRVLVPLRGVFEKMGASVDWKPAERTVHASKGSTEVSLKIGEKWASVNGQTLSMDVPAQILNGATMVPIRFVSEALGAQVKWDDNTRMVMIYSYTGNTAPPETPPATVPPTRPPKQPPVVVVPNPRPRPPVVMSRKFILERGTVVPISLLNRVSSRDSRRGQLVRGMVTGFTNSPEDWDRNRFNFPPGTVLEGRVTVAIPKDGKRPGILEITFNRIVLPNGKATPIDGSVIRLGDQSLQRNANGVLIATGNALNERIIFTGSANDGGSLMDFTVGRALDRTAIDGILGSLGATPNRVGYDVNLPIGARVGVRLNRQIAITIFRR